MDILYNDSLSRKVAFNCLMFMPEISNRVVFVNGKHPRISLPPDRGRSGFEIMVYPPLSSGRSAGSFPEQRLVDRSNTKLSVPKTLHFLIEGFSIERRK